MLLSRKSLPLLSVARHTSANWQLRKPLRAFRQHRVCQLELHGRVNLLRHRLDLVHRPGARRPQASHLGRHCSRFRRKRKPRSSARPKLLLRLSLSRLDLLQLSVASAMLIWLVRVRRLLRPLDHPVPGRLWVLVVRSRLHQVQQRLLRPVRSVVLCLQ